MVDVMVAYGNTLYRSGSVIVDFTSVINTEIHENPHGKLADAMVAMATNGISINGVRSSAQVVIGSLTGKNVNGCLAFGTYYFR